MSCFRFKVKNLKQKDKELRKMFKVCSCCNQVLIVKEFSKRKVSKDGYRNECKKCHYNKNKTRHSCICLQCGKEFKSQIKDAKFCNQQCMGKWKSENMVGEKSSAWKIRTIKPCEYCGKEIEVLPFRNNRSKHHFCSVDCYDNWQKESGWNKGINHVNYAERYEIKCSYCGEVLPPMTQHQINMYKHHFCTNKDCLFKWRKLHSPKGENHPRYNPNLTNEDREDRRNSPYYNEWIRQIYKKDGYVCRCCGKNSGFNAHHLNGYNWDKEHRFDVNNGITLCEDCHKEFHSLYGYGDNTIEQFREFLYNKYLKTNDLKYLNILEDIDIRATLINNLSLVS